MTIKISPHSGPVKAAVLRFPIATMVLFVFRNPTGLGKYLTVISIFVVEKYIMFPCFHVR